MAAPLQMIYTLLRASRAVLFQAPIRMPPAEVHINLDFDAHEGSIRSLNSDVLLQIFQQCRDSHPVSMWSVAEVNRRWRYLALNSPVLWSHIVLDSTTIIDGEGDVIATGRCLLNWARVWLERSGASVPLDIELNIQDGFPVGLHTQAISELFLCLCLEAPRWRSFSYQSADVFSSSGSQELQNIGAAAASLPLLTHLYLRARSDGPVHTYSTQDLYNLLSTTPAPALRTVYLQGAQVHSMNKFSSNAEHLAYVTNNDFDSSLCNTLATLRAHPNLRSLSLSGYSCNITTSGCLITVLGQLQKLTVTSNGFIAHLLPFLVMPHLYDIILNVGDVPTRACPHSRYSGTILDSLSCQLSASSFRALTLDLSDRGLPWSALIKLVKLERLRIIKLYDDKYWISCSDRLIRLHTKIQYEDDEPKWALPLLGKLILEVPQSPDGSASELDSKWMPIGLALQTAFEERWEAASEEGGAEVVRLVVELIAPGWRLTMEGRDEIAVESL